MNNPRQPWRVLHVEDDPVLAKQVKESLEESEHLSLSIHTITDFSNALEDINSRRYDLLILDVYAGTPSQNKTKVGIGIADHLRRVRFVPTIFYTALPDAVERSESPFVKVIGKEPGGLGPLRDAVTEYVNSGLLALNRALARHVEAIQLDYMEGFVAKHWSEMGVLQDRRALAFLLARRLAFSLAQDRMAELASALGEIADTGTPEDAQAADLVHRMQYYILPPISSDFLTGDILSGIVNGMSGNWVILTPSCDMVTGRGTLKAEFVQLCRCLPLEDFSELQEWKTSGSNMKRNALMALLKNNRSIGQAERYHYLPGVFDLPHSIVDFQQIEHVKFDELTSLKRLASLDSPFAVAILGRFNRYMARYGTPDLDCTEILTILGTSPRDSSNG